MLQDKAQVWHKLLLWCVEREVAGAESIAKSLRESQPVDNPPAASAQSPAQGPAQMSTQLKAPA
jgi:hypothetical protein